MKDSKQKLRNKLESFDFTIIGEFTSKSRLWALLEVSSATGVSYHDLAMCISDFENDYPRMTSNSSPCTKAELTKYQVWVIYKLMWHCLRASRQDTYQCLLNGLNPVFESSLSKDEYLRCQQEYQESECKDLCTTTRTISVQS
jgi:hypothetical protein